jgi:hypothetical protein
MVLLPVAVLGLARVARVALRSHFPTTHGLDDDWYNHAH